MGAVAQNVQDLMRKIGTLDMALESLSKVHKDHEDKMEELMKKISERKLVLIEELFKLTSHLSV